MFGKCFFVNVIVVFHQSQVIGHLSRNFVGCIFVLFYVKSLVAQLSVAFVYVKLCVHDYDSWSLVGGFDDHLSVFVDS